MEEVAAEAEGHAELLEGVTIISSKARNPVWVAVRSDKAGDRGQAADEAGLAQKAGRRGAEVVVVAVGVAEQVAGVRDVLLHEGS